MEIRSASSNNATTGNSVAARPNSMPQEDLVVKSSSSFPVNEEAYKTEKTEDTDKCSKESMETVTEGLNDFMHYLDTDLKFVLHQKTDRLIVQIVDIKTQKVLKEAPPKEILDVVAKIHDLVGALIDQKI
ncbi:MAG: flagellar protein FlaG [Firmicutes bacterium]|nr:flagellar protein FlaG [Bacillota bacterium]